MSHIDDVQYKVSDYVALLKKTTKALFEYRNGDSETLHILFSQRKP